jgi:elongation factor Ts
MEINAKLVKQLRDQTSAGMMDCKRALVDNNGDIEAAVEYLRKKGLMDAVKKSSRIAADGLIAVSSSSDQKDATIIEFGAETDFVAKSNKFQELTTTIAEIALRKHTVDEILKTMHPGTNRSIKEEIDALIFLVGENMTLRRTEKLSVSEGLIAMYVHNAVSPNMGKIGVLVAVESGCQNRDELAGFGKKIAMHIAAANPTYLCAKCVPQEVVNRERGVILAQAKEMGKSVNVASKMADGRINKFFEEIVLLEQFFVMDNKKKVKDVIEAFSSEIKDDVKVSRFVKFVLGENVEKTKTSFVDEVKSCL